MYKQIIFILLILTLQACDSPSCIDADDFGFPKIAVSSRPTVDSKGNDSNIYGSEGNQVMKWQSTGYQITGAPLTIMVRLGDNSRWGFYNGLNTDLTNINANLQGSSACIPDTGQSGIAPWDYYNSQTPQSIALQQPGSCYFNKGVGLYGLITSQDPNANETVLRGLPSDAETFHLGDNTNLFQDTQSGASVPKSSSDETYSGTGGFNKAPSSAAGNLFFKILDNYYDDNSGQYSLIIKSGVEVQGLRPIGKVISFVENTFQSVSTKLYQSIVVQTGFQNIVKLLLTLYIIFNAIFFIFGITQASQAQFALHILKIAIIMQLITSETSWNFFNNTFFSFFTKGVNTMMCIVTAQDSGCTATTMFNSFDDTLEIITAIETWRKALSLLFVQPEGFVLILLLAIAFIIFALALFKAVILFLIAYVATSLLVVLAPIFIPFLLFKLTSHLFNNLIGQFFNYFIQPIIVMASLSLWQNLIVTQLQKLLGFKVCWQSVFSGLFSFWKPIGVHSDPANDLNWIYAPGTFNGPLNQEELCIAAGKNFNCNNQTLSAFYQDNFNQSGTLLKYQDITKTCTEYQCLDLRFPDLPFLQPYIQDDWNRIQQIASGNYVTFTDLLLFALLIYLMYLFNNMVPDIARGISGGAGYGSVNLGAAAQGAYHDLKENAFNNRWAKRHVWDNIDRIKYQIGELGPIKSINKGRNYIADKLEYLSPIEKAKQNIRNNDLSNLRSKDMIGGKIESTQNLYTAMKEQALHRTTFGIMGKDHNDQNEKDKLGRTSLDRIREEYEYYHGIKGEDSAKLKTSINEMSSSVGTLNKWGKAAIAASIVNPYLGGAIGMVGAYKAAKSAFAAKQGMDELKEKPIETKPRN